MRPMVTIVGNISKDPELRYTASGAALLAFGVAINVRKKLADGSWEDGEPEFHDVVAWRDLAENAAESLTKGMRVMVSGSLQQRKWKADDGSNRSKTEIVADEIGPSLRWAAVDVRKTDRRQTAPASTSTPTPAAVIEYDEEPF